MDEGGGAGWLAVGWQLWPWACICLVGHSTAGDTKPQIRHLSFLSLSFRPLSNNYRPFYFLICWCRPFLLLPFLPVSFLPVLFRCWPCLLLSFLPLVLGLGRILLLRAK